MGMLPNIRSLRIIQEIFNMMNMTQEERGKIVEAIKTISDILKSDKSEGSYYHAWQSGIAMSFKDETERKATRISEYSSSGVLLLVNKQSLHDIANTAAKNFLNTLIQQCDNDK